MLSSNATLLLRDRYAHKGELGEGVLKRVSKAISIKDDKFENKLLELFSAGIFFPNSPTIRNAGRKKGLLSACFVLPIEDSIHSIFDAIKNMAVIFQRGGGCGFNFSALRPKDAPLSSGGTSSGSISFMNLFDRVTEIVKQGGFRRGAAMDVLNYNHPDILDFCRSKLTRTLTNFNLSVLVTDEFMSSLENGGEYIDLIHEGKKYGSLKSKDIFDLITLGGWVSGDPGLLFS